MEMDSLMTVSPSRNTWLIHSFIQKKIGVNFQVFLEYKNPSFLTNLVVVLVNLEAEKSYLQACQDLFYDYFMVSYGLLYKL